VGNFRNKIHPTSIKINDIVLECPHRTHTWLHVEASLFLIVHLGYLGGFMWRFRKELPISNSKILTFQG
jgi:hypothetical protein